MSLLYNMKFQRELKKEDIIKEWVEGNNILNVTLGAINNETITLFVDYIKTYKVEDIKSTLDSLLTSPYISNLVNKKKNIKIDCAPEINFKRISFPFKENYDNIIKEYNLEKFIHKESDEIIINEFLNLFFTNVDIYLSFINFGNLYIVNILPPIQIIDETEEDEY